jgi:hypothetical protein
MNYVLSVGKPTCASFPEYWIRGQLLGVTRFADGSFDIELFGDPNETPDKLHFDNGWDTQAFVSWWYCIEQREWYPSA